MRGLLATLPLLLHVGNAQLLATLCGIGATNCVPNTNANASCNAINPLSTDGACQQVVQSGVNTGFWITVSPASTIAPGSGFALTLYSNAGCTGAPVGSAPNLAATGTAGCTPFGPTLVYATTATAYALTSAFQGAGCTGTANLGYTGPTGCRPASTSASYTLQCGNAAGTAATVNLYAGSSCAGAPVATGGPPDSYFNVSTLGVCVNGEGSSTFTTCVPGTFTPPTTIAAGQAGIQFFAGQPTFPASAACPVTTPPSSYSVGPLDMCRTSGALSIRATCANGLTTLTTYSASSTCTGVSTAITYQAGCQVVTQGASSDVRIAQCATQSSGASSTALAAVSLLLAALALAAAVTA